MADIFISYTSSDRDWAFWIAQELAALEHVPHVHEWEIPGGGDIMGWMEERHHAADHVLLVVSEKYLSQPYSSLERRAAQWAAADERPNFALPVFIEPCKPPTLLAHIKRCDLHGMPEDEARGRLKDFLAPVGTPKERIPFPAARRSGAAQPSDRKILPYPGKGTALSNIPIGVPLHFMGRDEVLADIATAFAEKEGRVGITVLYGLRGVGKTTLAAAYGELHRGNYRATWWIRAQTESTMRADLVGLGVRLGWVATNEKEEPALAAVTQWLRDEGDGLLLIYDNAIDAASLRPYLPRGGRAHVLVTSNSHAWRGIAEPVALRLWPKEIGADYLIARTGRNAERAAAEALSEALGGLPLAHEQAAAYCERLNIGLRDYIRRFQAAPARLLDDARDTPAEYHDGLTVAKTFALAIEKAAKVHPATEPLIVHAALLAPEPIPLFLFAEGREKLGEPLAKALADDGLDEAIAALRVFALIDVETIADERDPTITTDCIRLHRLVRQVAAVRREGAARDEVRRALIEGAAAVYPEDVFVDPRTWPRARRLDAIVLALVGSDAIPTGGEASAASLLDRAAASRQSALAAYAQARPLRERMLAMQERVLGPEHPDTAASLNNLALLLQEQGDLAAARPLLERALAIREKVFGPEHPNTATMLSNLASLMQSQGDLAAARPLCERALAIREKALGPEHPDTAISLNKLAFLLQARGDLAGARPLLERAVAIHEKTLGPEHPHLANSLKGLAVVMRGQGDLVEARPICERVLAIDETVLGPEHPSTAVSLNNLATLLWDQGDLAAARPLYERALGIYEKVLGPEHPETAMGLNNLAVLLERQGDLAAARPLYERALAIREKVVGLQHPSTNLTRRNLAALLLASRSAGEALALGEAALAAHDKVLGREHDWTKASARVTADALDALDRADEAKALRARYGIDEEPE